MNLNEGNKRMFKILTLALIVGFVLHPHLSQANTTLYQGKVKCWGPYEQPQLGFPPDSIRVTVEWDPIFNNSDVSFVFRDVQGNGPARFYSSADTLNFPRTYEFQGTPIHVQGKSYEVWLEQHEDRNGPITTAEFIVEGHLFYQLTCEESH